MRCSVCTGVWLISAAGASAFAFPGLVEKPHPPLITTAPAIDIAGIEAIIAAGLQKRDNTLCGWISGDPNLPLTCAAGYVCGINTFNWAANCCQDPTDCAYKSACVPYSSMDFCDSDCLLNDHATLCSDTAYPYCYTKEYFYEQYESPFYELNCATEEDLITVLLWTTTSIVPIPPSTTSSSSYTPPPPEPTTTPSEPAAPSTTTAPDPSTTQPPLESSKRPDPTTSKTPDPPSSSAEPSSQVSAPPPSFSTPSPSSSEAQTPSQSGPAPAPPSSTPTPSSPSTSTPDTSQVSVQSASSHSSSSAISTLGFHPPGLVGPNGQPTTSGVAVTTVSKAAATTTGSSCAAGANCVKASPSGGGNGDAGRVVVGAWMLGVLAGLAGVVGFLG